METALMDRMLSRISTAEKVSLIRDTLGLDSDVSVTFTSNPDEYIFSYYGTTCTHKIQTILQKTEPFKRHLDLKIAEAKKVHEDTNTVAEALAEEKEFDIVEFWMESLPNVTTEEELAEIFEYNLNTFHEFWVSPHRQHLDEPTRAFLFEIHGNPFEPLWDRTE